MIISRVVELGKHRSTQLLVLVALAMYFKSKKQHLAAATVLAALSARYLTSNPSRESLATLVRYGAEARIYEKYFASNHGIVTFRSERGENLKILTALSLSSLTRNSQAGSPMGRSSKHVVFVSSIGLAALWAPAMARVLKRTSNDPTTVITHAVEIGDQSALKDLQLWLKRDLRGDKVTIVAHGDLTCGLLGKFETDTSMVFVNPLTGKVFPHDLPMKRECLSIYTTAFIKFVSLTRVLHEDCPPLVDRAIVEYAILSSKAHQRHPLVQGVVIEPTQLETQSDNLECEDARKNVEDMVTNSPVSSRLVAPAEFTTPSSTNDAQARSVLLCGDQDWWSGRRAYEQISSDLNCMRQPVFLRGLGSMPHLEDPDKFAEALLEVHL